MTTWGALFWMATGIAFTFGVLGCIFGALLYYRHRIEIIGLRHRVARLEDWAGIRG